MSQFALYIVYNRVAGLVLFVLFMMWMSTPSLVVFVGNWWRKQGILGTNEHKELRSEVGNQVEQVKMGNTS